MATLDEIDERVSVRYPEGTLAVFMRTKRRIVR
jgi:hypothetical protein